MARRIMIGTDPGQDGTFAILFVLGAPEALEIIEIAGRPDAPVRAGGPGPMVRPLKDHPIRPRVDRLRRRRAAWPAHAFAGQAPRPIHSGR